MHRSLSVRHRCAVIAIGMGVAASAIGAAASATRFDARLTGSSASWPDHNSVSWTLSQLYNPCPVGAKGTSYFECAETYNHQWVSGWYPKTSKSFTDWGGLVAATASSDRNSPLYFYCTDLSKAADTGAMISHASDTGAVAYIAQHFGWGSAPDAGLIDGAADHELYAAAQAAIWHYENGFSLDQTSRPGYTSKGTMDWYTQILKDASARKATRSDYTWSGNTKFAVTPDSQEVQAGTDVTVNWAGPASGSLILDPGTTGATFTNGGTIVNGGSGVDNVHTTATVHVTSAGTVTIHARPLVAKAYTPGDLVAFGAAQPFIGAVPVIPDVKITVDNPPITVNVKITPPTTFKLKATPVTFTVTVTPTTDTPPTTVVIAVPRTTISTVPPLTVGITNPTGTTMTAHDCDEGSTAACTMTIGPLDLHKGIPTDFTVTAYLPPNGDVKLLPGSPVTFTPTVWVKYGPTLMPPTPQFTVKTIPPCTTSLCKVPVPEKPPAFYK